MNIKRIKWGTLIICIALPVLVGTVSALLTREGMEIFSELDKPPLSPPAILFPIVWSILYVLMGIASYLVIENGAGQKKTEKAIKAYFLQLLFNFFWSIIFFNLGLYYLAFVWLLALLAFIILTTVRFFKISKWAGILMIPYIAWVAFAGYLNISIAFLN